MKRYLKIYFALIRINLIAFFAYRANFVNSTISSFMWGIFSVATILLITSRTDTLFGWKRDEVILLTAVFALIVGLFHLFFARNFERLSRIMERGQFDFELLRPVDIQFSISFWMINYSAIVRILIGIFLVIYLIFFLGYSVTFLNFIIFLCLILIGTLMLYSIWLFTTAFLIWIPELSNILDLLYSMNGLTRYPSELYKTVSQNLFLILLPIVFVATSPFKTLIGKASYGEIGILLFFCLGSLVVSRLFWKFGLKYYTSASN